MTKKKSDRGEDTAARPANYSPALLEEMLRENERLRSLAKQLEDETRRNADQVAELQEMSARLHAQQARQQQIFADFEVENRRCFAEYAEMEQQNANLANLYVASDGLHGSLERRDVLQVIQEIIINLIGSEELAVFEVDATDQRLKLLSSFGVDDSTYARLVAEGTPIARAAKTGELFVQEPPPSRTSAPASSLTACIPLKVNGNVIGVIAVFRMLPQKPELAAIDRQLFGLLEIHAAMALYCAGLHERQSVLG